MKRELFIFNESIPANAGYSNYYYFEEGSIVYIDEDYPYKFCILCDEEGYPILNSEGLMEMLEWNSSYGDYPIWEDKLSPFKTVEVEEEDEDYSDLTEGMEVYELVEILQEFPDDATIFLDVDGSMAKKYRENYGPNSVINLMEHNGVCLIVTNIPQSIEEISEKQDIDDILNSIDDFDSITVNFNNND